MKLTLAGTSSGMAVAHRAPSALFIEIGQDAYLIDAGDGTARQLVRLGLPYERLRAVIITHMHADHAAGLIGLIQLMHLSGRRQPITLFVPDSVRDRLEDLLPLYQIFTEKWPFDIRFYGLKNGQNVFSFSLKFKPVLNSHLGKNQSHAVKFGLGTECYSLMLGEKTGPCCLYTADIEDFLHLEPETVHAHLLISECTHVRVEQGIRFAQKHNIPCIWFTHIPPEVDEKLAVYRRQYSDPSIRFAEDGDTFELK